MRKNAIFLLIDALRYDVLADIAAARIMTPNLASLIDRGSVFPAIANGPVTQFVMPSLFSETYPLDYGGYNNGIRERPASFVECMALQGYQSHLMGTCAAMGLTLSFDRGFDVVHSAVDFRNILQYRIDKTLLHEFVLVDRGEQTASEAQAVVSAELSMILRSIAGGVRQTEKALWPAGLRRINEKVEQGCQKELELLETEPETVMWKLRTIRPKLYWRFLGQAKINPLTKFFVRLKESINWRTRAWMATRKVIFMPLGHYQVVMGDIVPGICSLLRSAAAPWFFHLHLMDAHDYLACDRPLNLIYRLKFLPRYWRARRAGLTDRWWIYDVTVMYMDEQIGKLLRTLEQMGQLDDTVIMVTGDHGYSEVSKGASKKKDMADRVHRDDLEVPLLLANAGKECRPTGLIDSMGVTATFLQALDVKGHESFKGRSAFGSGRPAVITEFAGRGNADLLRNILYFTVTTETQKLKLRLVGDVLYADALFDLALDRQERDNIIDDPTMKPKIDRLVEHLYTERGELLKARGARPLSWHYKAEVPEAHLRAS